MCYTVEQIRIKIESLIQRGYLSRSDFNNMPDSWVLKAFFYPSVMVITNEEPYKAKELSWGLIPSWSHADSAFSIRKYTLNARFESLREKPSYAHLVGKRLCLIPVSGFYEWRDINKSKYPYYIYMKNKESFMLAGLWDIWKEPETLNSHHTFTIITCEANDLMRKIHNRKKRMPVIIHKDDEEKWLTAKNYDEMVELCKPYDSSKMDAHTIDRTTIMNKVGYNVPGVNDFVFYPETEQKTLFD